MILTTHVDTDQGRFTFYAHGEAVVAVALPGADIEAIEGALEGPVEDGNSPVLDQAAIEFREYLDGERRHFEVPFRIPGTEFQQGVWKALCEIPYGETASYADIAMKLGRPGAARAVGQANRRNPLPVLVPCHRVVAADGSLGGYMGSSAPENGLKANLLRLEGQRP